MIYETVLMEQIDDKSVQHGKDIGSGLKLGWLL